MGVVTSIVCIVMGAVSIVYALLVLGVAFCMLHAAFRAARGKEYTYPFYNRYMAWRERRKAKKGVE